MEVHTDTQGPTAACGSGFGPTTSWWSVPQHELIARPPALHLHASCPTLVTSLHCFVHAVGRPCSRKNAHQQPGPPRLPVHPQLTQAFATGPHPHHYMYACNQHFSLYKQLQLAPTVECVHTTSSGHYHCPCWSLAGLGGIAEEPKALAATMEPHNT